MFWNLGSRLRSSFVEVSLSPVLLSADDVTFGEGLSSDGKEFASSFVVKAFHSVR